MKKMFTTSIFLFLVMLSIGQRLGAQEMPEWFTPLRDAIFSQNLPSSEVRGLYNTARERAEKELSGADLSVMLSRCEYMMGRVLHDEKNKAEAEKYFDRGLNYAQQAVDKLPSAEAWQMMADNIGYLCDVRSMAYLMGNALKVERYSKKALELDPGNTAAQFLITTRYIFAPSPFHNYKKGIQMLEDILTNYENRLHKDDRFNVYRSMGYAYGQQKKKEEARAWYRKALDVYPDNKLVKNLLEAL